MPPPSPYCMCQPPCRKPPEVSSSGPPGAWAFPSSVRNSFTITLRISSPSGLSKSDRTGLPDSSVAALDRPGAVLLHDLAVEVDLSARAQVLDDVPVDVALVRPAELGQAVSEREVDRPVDLLIEERVLHEARDAGVAADAELAQRSPALVAVEPLDEKVLLRVGRGVDHPTGLEAQPDAPDLPPSVGRGKLDEGDLPLGRVLDGRVVELPAGHVRAARIDLALPPGEAEPDVRLRADDPHLLGLVEMLGVRAHAVPLRVPVEEAGAEEEVLVRAKRHPCILRERRRRVVAADPREIVRVGALEHRPDR